MKATLTFNLPEETDEHQLALNAGKVLGAIQDFDNYLRAKLKYEELSETESQIYRAVRDKLHEEFQNAGVTVWA